MLIRYALEVEPELASRAAYTLELLLDGIGLSARRTSSTAEADLVYSTVRPHDLRADALWLAAAHGPDWDEADVLDGDIVRSTYAVVSGALERHCRRDAFGVPVARDGGGTCLVDLELPVVAQYVERLAAALTVARGAELECVPRWPDGKTYAVVLSHDVDKPFVRAPWTFYRRRLGRDLAHRDPRAAARGVGQAAKAAVATRFAPLPAPAQDPNFCFADWLRLESELGSRSCFYVAVTTSAEDDASPHDVTYDFRRPEVVAQLHRALAGGWEVGLHASINARDIPGRIAAERELLESVLGDGRVTGVRHHYWALDSELPERTLREHADAGLVYDSSLGLNDAFGFRRGMAWPFRPFDRERGAPVDLIEVPPTLMDGSVFSSRVTAEEGRRLIEAHLATVRRYGGAAVLDWHLEQLNPRRLHGAGAVLRDVLRGLAGDGEVFWASPAELARWWQRRAALLALSERA